MTGLYLMHTRECYNADIEVYKLGRSKTLDNRVKQYPNGSKILFMMNCINSILLESILIKLFKTKYVQQTLYGTEYFLGNQKEMIKDIINCILTQDIPIVLNTNNNTIPNTNINTITNCVPNTITNCVPNVKQYIPKSFININNDRTCHKCSHVFKYPSMLKIHFKTYYHCLTSEEDMHTLFIPTIKTIKCNNCEQSFSQKSSLYRHHRNINCSQLQNTTTIPISIIQTINK